MTAGPMGRVAASLVTACSSALRSAWTMVGRRVAEVVCRDASRGSVELTCPNQGTLNLDPPTFIRG